MKHHSLTYKLAALATLLVVISACTNISVVEEVCIDKPVVFSAFTDARTKAEITSVQQLVKEGGFVVYGYSTDTLSPNWASADTIFNAQTVNYDSVTVKGWAYSPVKYWNDKSKYCFYAVAPYKPTVSSVTYTMVGNGDAKLFKISDVASAKSSVSDDIMICRSGVKNVKGASHAANISFTFNHIMSKVDVKVVKSDNLDSKVTIKITSLTMTGWDADNGDFVQKSTKPDGIESSEWKFASTAHQSGTALFIGTNGNETASEKTVTLNSSTKEKLLTDSYIMVPQSFTVTSPATETTLTFSMKYTLSYTATDNNGKEYSEDFSVVGKFPTAHCWGTDTHTTYTLTVQPKSIGISAACSSWSEKSLSEIEIQ